MKAADAKMDKEISQYKKLDSHLSKKLSEENKKVQDLQKELEVHIIRSYRPVSYYRARLNMICD